MPRFVKAYVKFADAISHVSGLFAMYLVFGLLAVLLIATFMKSFFLPLNWTVEMAQFIMVAYYLLGGAWSLKNDEHVRMDLLYAAWPVRRKAKVNIVTDLAMVFFLVLLLVGGIASMIYALKTGERSFSAWRPYMAPIKIIMNIGILLTLMQAIAILFKDWAAIRGESLS